MSQELKDNLLKAFPSKMENRQAFIMQFVMEQAQKGNPPPSRDALDKAIEELVSEGVFEIKGDLLILKVDKPSAAIIDDEELSPAPVIQINGDFSENQLMILSAFQGKFENRTALVMNAVMNEVSKGNPPPPKDELEKSIDELIESGTLEVKGSMLIKKI
ncbi:MAG: hypothetical protein ACXAEU_26215 [Candidatus Hodarchaeales archaeon]|jgi:hypothetical protein